MVKLKNIIKVGVSVISPVTAATYIATKYLIKKDGGKEVKNEISDIVNDGKEIYGNVADGVNAITGKDKINDAVERGKKLAKRAENAKQNYDSNSAYYKRKINKSIHSINAWKKRIKERRFKDLAEKISVLKNYKIEDYPLEKDFENITNIPSIDSSQDLFMNAFEVDGLNVFLPLYGGLPGVIIQMILNRKLADKLNEELDKKELCISEGEAKIALKLRELNLIDLSLKNILYDFSKLENIFIKVTALIDDVLAYMKSHNIHKIGLLPDDLKLKFRAVREIKDILKGVVEKEILKNNGKEQIQQCESEVQNISNSTQKIYENAFGPYVPNSNQQENNKQTDSYSYGSANGKLSFVVTRVYTRNSSSANVEVTIYNGTINIGDEIYFTSNLEQEYGPYEIISITPNTENSVSIEFGQISASSLSNTVYPGWIGYK